MAKGTATEQFVVLSSVRTGLKREFAFAMKAQSEICGSLGRTRATSGSIGRTRASRNRNAARDVDRPEKRSRKSGSVDREPKGENLKDAVVKTEGGDDKNVGDVMSEEEAKSDVVDVEEPKTQVGESVGKSEALDDDADGGNEDAIMGDGGGFEEVPKSNVVAEDEAKMVGEEVEKVLSEGEVKEGELCCPKEDGVGGETPVLVAGDHGSCSVKGVTVEKPQRRFTRSALKRTSDVDDDAKVVGNDEGKAGAEAVEVGGDGMEGVDGGSKDVEVSGDAKEEIEDGTLVSSPVQMKMSRTSTRKRCPTNLKDLLATGILEGLPVNYFRSMKARGPGEIGLQGVISGNGIVCYCETCHGVEVVTPTVFELHAGSSNKRPPEYIYLESGSTLRDVMNTCSNVPLDTLEEAVQKVLGGFTMKKSTFCFNCRDVSVVSRLLCNSCTGLKKCQPSPTQTTETSNDCDSLAVQSRSPEPAVVPKSLSNGMKHSTSHSKSEGKLTRKDLRLHRLVFENDVLPDGSEVAYYAHGERLLEGYKKGFGIFCYCCDSEVSPSVFEAHAGWASRRKPYLHIYTSDGVSLHELSIKSLKERKFPVNENDDLCSICQDGGDLLCCDGCPRAFHLDCVPLACVPNDSWYCKYCRNVFEKDKYVERNANALAAGRKPGVDPFEQKHRSCIRRIVKTDQVDHEGCILCRRQYFSKNFSTRTMMICEQCEKEYHVGCLKDHNIENLEALPEGNWFCCSDCSEVHTALVNLVAGEEENIPDSLISLIKRKHEEKGLETEAGLDIKWRVLNWKLTSPDENNEIRKLLSKAVAIFHDRFGPINSDSKDFIPAMVYGRKVGKYYDFGGMYCAVLMVNKVIVSVAIFRVFGIEVAELPLVATPKEYQGQGYFQCLFSCIERLLSSLKVRNLALPAAEEAESIWTNKFGFTRLDQEQINDYKRRLRMMIFQGTPLLQKPVPGAL